MVRKKKFRLVTIMMMATMKCDYSVVIDGDDDGQTAVVMLIIMIVILVLIV